MNWFQKISQKMMPLPHQNSVPPRYEHPMWGGLMEGADRVNNTMSFETAEQQELMHPNMRYLGQGDEGIVYDMGDQVIKFTDSEVDARAAQKLFYNPVPCVVRVLKEPEKIQDTPPIFKLTLEKVRVLTDPEKREVDDYDDYHDYDSPVIGGEAQVVKDRIALRQCLLKHGYTKSDDHMDNIGYSLTRMVLLDLGGLW